MNTWRDRLLIGLLLLLFQRAHGEITAPLPNTEAWALIFFGTAATLELFILKAAPKVLNGHLCDDMQMLSYICIIVDAIGFAAYMTQTPSVYYNTVMWGISYVQWARLLFVDSGHARSCWNNLVRRPYFLGA